MHYVVSSCAYCLPVGPGGSLAVCPLRSCLPSHVFPPLSSWAWLLNLEFICIAVLVGLYEEPERPPNAVDFIKKYLGAPVGVDIDALRAENERLKSENRTLHTTVEELNKRVRLVCFPRPSFRHCVVRVFRCRVRGRYDIALQIEAIESEN